MIRTSGCERVALIVDALHAAGKLLRLSFAVAIEDGEIDLALDQAGRLHAADTAPDAAEVAVNAEFRIEPGAVGTLLLHQALALAGK